MVENDAAGDVQLGLADETKQWLLRYARHVIVCHLRCEAVPVPNDIPLEAMLPAGCFVSLHSTVSKSLRGCIGTFMAVDPLWQTVASMAVAAATCDPRFAPLQLADVSKYMQEISVLSPRKEATVDEIIVGIHGLWIECGQASGVLLPQVAVDKQWDKETFLQQTCIKAGLCAEQWSAEDVQLKTFTAVVFSE